LLTPGIFIACGQPTSGLLRLGLDPLLLLEEDETAANISGLSGTPGKNINQLLPTFIELQLYINIYIYSTVLFTIWNAQLKTFINTLSVSFLFVVAVFFIFLLLL
jgi:hypothetical protein